MVWYFMSKSQTGIDLPECSALMDSVLVPLCIDRYLNSDVVGQVQDLPEM